MRFLADESIEAPVIERLRHEGYEVAAVAENNPGSEDGFVLRRATSEDRILITNDKDFAELAFLQQQTSTGIILLRLGTLRSVAKAKRLLEVLRSGLTRVGGAMTEVEASALRRRPIPKQR